MSEPVRQKHAHMATHRFSRLQGAQLRSARLLFRVWSSTIQRRSTANDLHPLRTHSCILPVTVAVRRRPRECKMPIRICSGPGMRFRPAEPRLAALPAWLKFDAIAGVIGYTAKTPQNVSIKQNMLWPLPKDVHDNNQDHPLRFFCSLYYLLRQKRTSATERER